MKKKIKIIGEVVSDKELGNKVVWKNHKLLNDFTAYCKSHPELRFWQALRNWSEADFIYYQKGGSPLLDTDAVDTFYWNDIGE